MERAAEDGQPVCDNVVALASTSPCSRRWRAENGSAQRTALMTVSGMAGRRLLEMYGEISDCGDRRREGPTSMLRSKAGQLGLRARGNEAPYANRSADGPGPPPVPIWRTARAPRSSLLARGVPGEGGESVGHPDKGDARRPVRVLRRCPFFVGQAQVVHPGGDLRGPVHGRPRHRNRKRRVAVDTHRSQLHQREPAVGPHRLRDPVRRLSASRRPPRRPVRPPPGVHGRLGDLHGSLAHVRIRLVGGVADHFPRRPGLRRRIAVPGRALDPRHHVHRGRERNLALGIWGGIAGSGAAAGTLLGGVLPALSAGSGSSSSTCRSAPS